MKNLPSIVLYLVVLFVISACGASRPPGPNLPKERLIGHDYLAALHQSFPVSEATSYVSKNTPVGVLAWTFGTDPTRLNVLFNKISNTYVRVHLGNTTCIRNRNCGPYEVGFGHTVQSFDKAVRNKDQKVVNFLKSETEKWYAVSTKYPKLKFLISPFLEHNLSLEGWRSAADIVRSSWGNVTLVNNPENSVVGEPYLDAWMERHGDTPDHTAKVSSLDGEDGSDINVTAWLENTKGNKLTYVWSRSYNCRHMGDFVDPRSRNSCPKPYQLEELYHLTDPLPAPPQFTGSKCRSITQFKAPNIWKPFAEDKGTPDPRANLPVLIAPYGKADVEVLNSKGTSLGKLKYYGSYTGGGNRYYAGSPGAAAKNGYTFQKEAVATAGSPYVWVHQSGRCYGPLVPGRRNGSYR